MGHAGAACVEHGHMPSAAREITRHLGAGRRSPTGGRERLCTGHGNPKSCFGLHMSLLVEGEGFSFVDCVL